MCECAMAFSVYESACLALLDQVVYLINSVFEVILVCTSAACNSFVC